MDKRAISYFLPLLAAMFWHALAHAEAIPVGDRVSFHVEASREVQNDQVSAVLQAQAEDRDAAKLADEINRTMSWALQQVKTGKGVMPQSGNYRTYPVYEDRKIVRWRGVQELHLESRDVEALSRLLGSLQARLQIQSMQFSVSTGTRDAIEDELIAEALDAFRKRASLIAKSLKASGYALLDINIGGAGRPPVVPMRMESAARVSAASVAPPAVEQGSSSISVQVSGSIHLLRE
ncbi:putative secreted protein [Thiogranum longum]|uniref:Putative secreted protein n=1 Tax=Thiogranum longum TaxID=1537524 RepID=A0A4R1H7I5_9GAMM|nr:SIMPL domain-containing protein [Thiogranum longum]TCK17784.1 putative secreted protein [Thiogranum longum]